jgi:COP9 signalosome complex subunit 2
LYESFRNYQEAGNTRARDLLKYVVVASMLSTATDINPFAAREAKVFSDDREIVAMSDLRACLEANDLARFERTVRNKQNRIIDEPFLMTYIQPLRRRMREQVRSVKCMWLGGVVDVRMYASVLVCVVCVWCG